MSRDQERELTRRALIKWSLAAGAALGVSQTRIFDILGKTAGTRTAEAAAANPTKRTVHFRAGQGTLAWFTLLWPHNDIAAGAGANANTTWPFPATATQRLRGTAGELTIGPNTPFATAMANKQMTAIMAGSNETHTANADSIVRSASGNSLFALMAQLQQATPTVLPVISVGNAEFGSAPGAPRAAVVPTGPDIVGLFNSAASRAGSVLDKAKTGHADLYRAHYETLAHLNRAAAHSTTRDTYATARNATRFLGTNLADKLQITAADEQAYGVDQAGMPNEVKNIARILIISAKAFQLRLTSSVLLPVLQENATRDPHGAFGNMTQLNAVTAGLKRVFDAFLADLGRKIDPVTGTPIADDLVMTIDGDTPKTPLDRTNWLDNTPGNSNWMYVYGGGRLKTGWFGGINRGGQVSGFDPKTGAAGTYNGDEQARAAVAAVSYAVTGDKKHAEDLARVDITGMVQTA